MSKQINLDDQANTLEDAKVDEQSETESPVAQQVVKQETPKEEKTSVLTDADKRSVSLAILTEKTEVMNPVEYSQMKKVAKDFWQSGAISDSFDNEMQVVMALAAGREMGMSFNESINGLYFVKGSLNIYGKATPAQLRRHGWRVKYKDEVNGSCTAVVTNEKTGEEIEDTFTFEEAKQSGFTESYGKVKPGWLPGANRKRKLRYGVLSLIIHTYIPEVVGSVAGIAEYSQDYIEVEAQATSTVKVRDDARDGIKAALRESKIENGKSKAISQEQGEDESL